MSAWIKFRHYTPVDIGNQRIETTEKGGRTDMRTMCHRIRQTDYR